MPNIKINQSKETPVSQRQIEVVERKGLGHPDTICDSLVECISSHLSLAYIERFGRVLHFNLDKAMLAAGTSEPNFGGGKITSPMKFVLGDRATSRFGEQDIALDPLIERSVKDWFKQNLARVDPEQHVVVQSEIQPGSAELTGIFQREQVVANDTSAAVGYAPLSETERIVLNTERWLNSRETKQRFPVIGQDIKLMAVRNSKELSLTTAIAFVDQHVSSVQDYFAHKEAITSEILKHVESQLETIAAVNVQLNTLDDRQLGKSGIYLTVTGTSVECGDSGQVGRGNNVRGLISLNRPVSNEAAAGKNPVSHVGKIYNLLSYEIADRIYESVEGVEEVYVWLVSQIGRPISQPWLASASVRLKSDGLLSDVEAEIQKVFQHQLDGIAGFCERLIGGNTIVC